jgi:hypothetical protein
MTARPHPFGLATIALGILACAAAADAQIVRTFDIAGGGRLVLDADRGAVEVRARGDRGVRVEVQYGNRSANDILDEFNVGFATEGNQLTVQSRARFSGWTERLFGQRTGLRFVIDVPAAFDLDLRTSGGSVEVSAIRGDVRARTSGGSLRLAAVDGPVHGRTSGGSIELQSANDADLETSGGGISVGQVRNGVRAETSGGSIRVALARTVDARTSGGSITLDAVGGAIAAHTSGGSISAALTGQPGGDSRLETSGGGVTLTIPSTIAANLDARTRGGGVRVDVPVTVEGTQARNHIQGRMNGGGPLLVLRSSGGSVQVRRR